MFFSINCYGINGILVVDIWVVKGRVYIVIIQYQMGNVDVVQVFDYCKIVVYIDMVVIIVGDGVDVAWVFKYGVKSEVWNILFIKMCQAQCWLFVECVEVVIDNVVVILIKG